MLIGSSIDVYKRQVIHFAQKKEIIEPLYCGDLYIDAETNALLQARFEVDPVSYTHLFHVFNLFVVICSFCGQIMFQTFNK